MTSNLASLQCWRLAIHIEDITDKHLQCPAMSLGGHSISVLSLHPAASAAETYAPHPAPGSHLRDALPAGSG